VTTALRHCSRLVGEVMFQSKQRSSPGQALVEFALVIGVVLLFVFVIIESARYLQAWQTVQNAAREAGRYAITGQFEPDCLSFATPCELPHGPRVHSIKETARRTSAGLIINPDADYNDPQYYLVQVWGMELVYDHATDEWEYKWLPDRPGHSNQPVLVRVTYRMPTITPILQPIVGSIRVIGQVIVNNENFNQYSNSMPDPDGPSVPPPPPPEEPFPDLIVVKSASPEPVLVNSNLDYTIIVNNFGETAATNVLLTDTLPAEVTPVTTSLPPNCNYVAVGHRITCNLGTISPYQTEHVINLRVRTPETIPQSPITITNGVMVTALQSDSDMSNNSDTATSRVIEHGTDLELVSKWSNPYWVTEGHPFQYEIVVRNNGPDEELATVTVTDPLPANVTYVSANASQGSCNHDPATNTVECALGQMAKNAGATVTINVIAPNTDAIITLYNEATVVSNRYDPLPDNNSNPLQATLVVPALADLYVLKTNSPTAAGLNAPLTYTVRIENYGPATATGVVLTDTLPKDPQNIRMVDFVSSEPAGICGTQNDGDLVVCNVGAIGGMAPDNVVFVTLHTMTTRTGTALNRVEVANNGPETDLNPVNNTAFSMAMISSADLQVHKSSTPTSNVNSGDVLTYTITITNHGSSSATGVVLTDTLPASYHFYNAIPAQGNCNHSGSSPGGIVVCQLGALAPGQVTMVRIVGVPTESGSITNRVDVRSAVPDPILSNNWHEHTRTIGSGNQFITVTPTCGDPGTVVTVRGYNWPTGGAQNERTLEIVWDPAPGGPDPETSLFGPTPQGSFDSPTFTQTVTIPMTATIPALHTIQAIRGFKVRTADAPFRVPCPKPDLVIGNLQLLTTGVITTFEPVSFRTTITNIGNLDANAQFFVSLYANPNPPPNVGSSTHISQEFQIATVAYTGLSVNSSIVVTLTAQSGFPVTGTHTVYVVADSNPAPTGNINELRETNNISQPLAVVVTGDSNPPPPPPDPDDPAELFGLVRVALQGGGSPVLHGNVLVRAYHEDHTPSNPMVWERVTNSSGIYAFTFAEGGLLPGEYTVTGCITVNNVEYFTSAILTLAPGESRQHNMVLTDQPCQ
jgi:uncharacterized repeat protein (TIGR01451 family)